MSRFRIDVAQIGFSIGAACAFGALGVTVAASAVGCAPIRPRAVPPKAAAPSVMPVELPRWRAVPVPPDEEEIAWQADTREGFLAFDHSGARWLLPHDAHAAPQPVGAIDSAPWVHRATSSTFPLVFFTGDDRVLAARTALGTPEPIATLPKGADPATFRVFRGAFTVRVGNQMLASRDGASFRSVAPLAGHVFVELLLSPDGRGLGLFAPGKVARTVDGGESWLLLPTDGLAVETLDEEQGRALLRPGGVRDGLPRSVDLDDGKIARDPTPRRLVLRDGHRLWPSPPRATEDASFRLSRHGSRHFEGRTWDVTGDQLVSLQNDALLEGKLGEALQMTMPDSQGECGAERLAACDDQVAVTCDEHAFLYGKEGEPLVIPVRKDALLAFDRRGALVSVVQTPAGEPTSDAEDAPAKPRGAIVRLHEREHPATFTERTVPDLSGDHLVLTGGCHRPALWLSADLSAVRIDPPAFEDPQALPAKAPWPGESGVAPAAPLGVRADGQLVMGTPSGLVFVPSGKTFELGPANEEQVSFAEDGAHGLWLQTAGPVLQTADGGLSWSPLPTPSATPAWGGVLCGATRCLFGRGVYLDGFVKEPSYTAPAAPPKVRRVDERAKLRCRPEPLAYPRGRGTLSALSPRLGAELFAGIAGDPETTPGSARWAVFAGLDRRFITRSLPPVALANEVERGNFSQYTGTAGAVSVVRAFGSNGDTANRGHYRTSSKGPLATTSFVLNVAHWLSLDEVGEPMYPGNLLVWGKRAPEALPFRVSEGRVGPGVFVREPAGGLLAAELGARSLSLSIMARRGDETQLDHAIVARAGSPREIGVGLAASPEERGVYLLENTVDERPEIRFHALSETLALGPAVPVPGTLGKPNALLELPACAADPRGSLFRTITQEPLRTDLGRADEETSGYIQRLIRVTARGACVERTFVTPDDGLDAELVLAGSTGIAVSAQAEDELGLRCEPLDVSPD